jgi:hypothetical protein
MNKSNVTINWIDKEGKRGLTEEALTKLRGLAISTKETMGKGGFTANADNLQAAYDRLRAEKKFFTFIEELEVVSKYVNVKLRTVI